MIEPRVLEVKQIQNTIRWKQEKDLKLYLSCLLEGKVKNQENCILSFKMSTWIQNRVLSTFALTPFTIGYFTALDNEYNL